MKRICFFLVLVALIALWTEKKFAGARLSHDLVTLQQRQRERSSLVLERERLRQRLAGLEHAAIAGANAGVASRETNHPTPIENAALPPISIGDWTPAQNWRRRGQATPRAAIETVLWAAAGGEVNALRNLIDISQAGGGDAAATLLNSMPPAIRATYQDPADLVAALTVRHIPLGEAQLVWVTQTGPDNATACLFLKNPLPDEPSAGSLSPSETTVGISPPQLPADNHTAIAYLSLHRDAGRWQLVVPPSAIEKMAQDTRAAVPSGT